MLVKPAHIPLAGLGLIAEEDVSSSPVVRLPLNYTLLAFDPSTTNGQFRHHIPVGDARLQQSLEWLARQEPGETLDVMQSLSVFNAICVASVCTSPASCCMHRDLVVSDSPSNRSLIIMNADMGRQRAQEGALC